MQSNRYNRHRSYRWNYQHAPDVIPCDEPPVAGDWTFCGMEVSSPLGVAAGPLLNGQWCLYYAALGFDVVTYKTVRSGPRPCYPLPNLVPVDCLRLDGSEPSTSISSRFRGSWAVSFGMPSQPIDVWQADIRETRQQLPSNKKLNVSVVGTVQPGWSLDQLADDYAGCAVAARAAGADAVELNFSCPNVNTRDGQLYQQPDAAEEVARRVRAAVDDAPLIVKIGHVRHADSLRALLARLSGVVSAVAMTNSVATRVLDQAGHPLFANEPRGICGQATVEASIAQVRAATSLIDRHDWNLRVIGVGGISTAADVRAYLAAGAECVQLATAIMIDPHVGLTIRRQML